MRLLGSFFHIAMNGMAASEKIFKLLNLSTEKLYLMLNRQDLIYRVEIFISDMMKNTMCCRT